MAGRKTQIPANILPRITKIFITNLPEKCSGKDLSEFIRNYGDIYDLYIARKRDKMGNRFGFVSFLDVKDGKELIKQISNTRIGDCVLKANVARFTLEEGEIRPDPVNVRRNFNQQAEKKAPTQTSTYYNGSRSFSDMLTGRNDVKTVAIESHVNAFARLHGKAVVARMLDLDALKNIYVIVEELTQGSGKVQYLGGLSVLVSFEDSESVPKFLSAAREVLGRFNTLDVWEGQSFGYERLAWLKVVGIPLHLITAEVIDAVGGVFGKVLHRAERSDMDDVLSYDYVGVLVGDGKKISEEVKIVWRDRKFSVWVSENSGEWVPDFFKSQPTTEVNNTSQSEAEEEDTTNMEEDHVTPEKEPDPVNVFPVGVEEFLVTPLANNECINSPSILEKNPEVLEVNDTFIPGKNFDFEKDFEKSNVDEVRNGNVVLKRKKKSLLGSVNKPNPAYSSSLEKTKVGKKPKGDDDTFGLNGMLGLNGEDGPAHPYVTDENEDTICIQEVDPGVGLCQEEEVAATIILGEQLGADLGNATELIVQSITIEGVQGGLK